MADEIEVLLYKLEADLEGLDKALKEAEQKTDNASKGIGKSFDKIGKSMLHMTKIAAGAAAALAAVGTAITIGLIKKGLAAGDALAKVSDKLGVATEELAGMRFAAEQTGVAAGTLDMAMQRMTRRVSEAAKGLGEARGALQELGLDAKEMAKLSPDEQLRKIADAMSNVTEQGDRVRLAMRLFDSEGVALVNTLKLGSKGLLEMRDEAKALGLAISRTDAAKIERANDAMHRIDKALEGLSLTFAKEFAPVIEALSDEIIKLTKDSDVFTDAARAALGIFLTALRVANDVFRRVRITFAALEVSIAAAEKKAADAGRTFDDVFSSLSGGASEEWATLGGELEGSAESADRAAIALSEAQANLVAVQNEAAHTAAVFDELIDKLDEMAKPRKPALNTGSSDDSLVSTRDPRHDGSGPFSKSAEEEMAEFFKNRVATLEKMGIKEEELIETRRELRLAELDEMYRFGELELTTIQELEDAKKAIVAESEEEMKRLREEGMTAQHKIWESGLAGKLSVFSSIMGQLTGLMQSENKKQFEIGKKAAMAQAALSIPLTAIEAYKALAGIPVVGPGLGAAAAAAATVAGLSNLDRIKSTQFGSGGGGASTPAQGSGVGGNAAPGGDPAGIFGGPSRVTNITLNGERFDKSTVRAMVDALNEEAGDNHVIRVG